MTTDSCWHRISILSVVHFFISRGLRLFKTLGLNAGPIIIAAAVAINNASFWFGIFSIFLLSILLTDTLISYLTFRFQICDNQIIVKQGFFTREVLNLKYDRIQNVNISVPWYFKPFKLVNCILDSAGSSNKEASIPGINEHFAQSISQQINDYHQDHQINEATSTEPFDSSEQSVTSTLKLSNKEVIKYGFTNSMIFVMAAASFPIVQKYIERAGWTFSTYYNDLAGYLPLPELVAKITIIVFSIVLFGLLLLCITALGSFIRFYNYELQNISDKLKRIAGLLDRQEIAVRKHKIQGISIKQNLFAKILNRVTVHFHQAQSEHSPQSKKQHLIIPMLKPDQWQQYITWVYDDFSIKELKFESISKYYFFRLSMLLIILPITLLVFFLSWNVSTNSFIFLALIPVGICILWFRYRRYGYLINEHFGIIRSGFIGVKYTLFPLYKLQKINEKQSRNQRKRGLCSIELQLAFGILILPYLPLEVANKIIKVCLYKVESSEKNWL
ncbi:MAG: PH domain-containing protein [Gammaproteobacteria bacterium]|nr:PH domain-containing protein [Gammaproteobacteria bacterium]